MKSKPPLKDMPAHLFVSFASHGDFIAIRDRFAGWKQQRYIRDDLHDAAKKKIKELQLIISVLKET